MKELQSRLSQLEQQIGRRQGQRKQIIDRRARELIEGDETQWNGNKVSEASVKADDSISFVPAKRPEPENANRNRDDDSIRHLQVPESINQIGSIPKSTFATIVEVMTPSIVRIQIRKPGPLRRTKVISGDRNVRPGSGVVLSSEDVEKLKAMLDKNGQKNEPIYLSDEETGSGIILTSSKASDFFVVTNNHLIDKVPLEFISIHLHDGRIIHPEKVLKDAESDIAVMKLGISDLKAATWGDSRKVNVGDVVLSMGNTFGPGRSVAFGIIGARNLRQLKLGKSNIINQDFFQTNTPTQLWNSGGPLINLNGDVIGINTTIGGAEGGSELVLHGIGLAISSDLAQRIMDQLLEFGQVRRAWIGVKLDEAFDFNAAKSLKLDRLEGARVHAVFPDSPASRAGLQPDDVILNFDGTDVKDYDQLINLVSLSPIGKEIEMTVWREQKNVTLTIVLADRSQLSNPTDAQSNANEVPKEAEKTPPPGEPMGQVQPSYKDLATSFVEAREEISTAKDEIVKANSEEELAARKKRWYLAQVKYLILKDDYVALLEDTKLQLQSARAELDSARSLIDAAGKDGGISNKGKELVDAKLRRQQAEISVERIKSRLELYENAGRLLLDGTSDDSLLGTLNGDTLPYASIIHFEIPEWGLQLQPLPRNEMNQIGKTKYRGGMRVLEVKQGSPATEHGIQKGRCSCRSR